MDTTNLAELIALMTKSKDSGVPTSLMIASVILGCLAPTLASIAAYFKAKSAEKNTAEAKQKAEETAQVVEKVHEAVNSGRTVMIEKHEEELAKRDEERVQFIQQVKELRDQILDISKEKVRIEEHQRGTVAKTDTAVPAQPESELKELREQIAELRKRVP